LLAAAAIAMALAAGGAAAAPAARAGISPVIKYTVKGSSAQGAVAGYFAQTSGLQRPVGFTDEVSYLGNDGQRNQEKFAVNTTSDVTNGGGIGLCDPNTHVAVQEGDTYIGGGLMDVVFGAGTFGPAINNGDPCENGIVNPFSTALLENIPVDDTVLVNILYDGHHAHNGCHAGQVLFLAQDLSAASPLVRSNCIWLPRGTVFTEADAGVTADAVDLSALPGGVPQPNIRRSPYGLMTWAHALLSGNYLDGPGTVHGSFWNSSLWTAYTVAATSNGFAPPAGTLLIAPGVVNDDSFRVYEGFANG
jgi:hypothetical protein